MNNKRIFTKDSLPSKKKEIPMPPVKPTKESTNK